MVCLSCSAPTRSRLCADCSPTVRPAPERILPGGLRLVAAFEHNGAARVLAHHLKYRGITDYAEVVAEVLASRVPRLPLVPVPRALTRRLKYGVDPAREIAASLGRRLGVPVVGALATPIHSKRRAGRDHSRPVRPFRIRSPLRSPVNIVDDVVTTGATVLAAAGVFGSDRVQSVVAANVVQEASNVTAVVTSPDPGMDEVWQLF